MYRYIYETETTKVYELKLDPTIQKVVDKATGYTIDFNKCILAQSEWNSKLDHLFNS